MSVPRNVRRGIASIQKVLVAHAQSVEPGDAPEEQQALDMLVAWTYLVALVPRRRSKS